jgi:hypothetical protein
MSKFKLLVILGILVCLSSQAERVYNFYQNWVNQNEINSR